MIVLIRVHHFVTSKTASFSECQISALISNEKRKRYTVKSTMDQEGERSRTEGLLMTMSVLTLQFAQSSLRVRQIPI